MLTIEAHRHDVDTADLARRTAGRMNPQVTGDGPYRIVDAETGDLIVAVGRLDQADLAAFRHAATSYAETTTTTYRAAGIRNRSRIFGYMGASVTMRRDGCRACAGAGDAPADHAAIVGTAEALAAIMAELAPEQAEHAATAIEEVGADWRIERSPWTSGVLNVNSAMPYHRDGNNLPGVWSAMVVLRDRMGGGHLHLPEWGIVLPCRDGDVVIFEGARWWHGVTELRPKAKDAQRLTAVFYAVASMRNCADDEVTRTQTTRTAREEGIAAGLDTTIRRPATAEPATFQVAVVSHGRSEQVNGATLRLLAERGVPAENVRLFVTPDQIDEYRRHVDPGLATVEAGGYGLAAQRRHANLAHPEGARLVHMDDDVVDVRRRIDDKTVEPIGDLSAFFNIAFDLAVAEDARLWGLYPVLNPKFMKDRVRTGLAYLLGQTWGVINSHDPELQVEHDQKEDYERTLRFWEADGNVVRIEWAAAKSRMYAKGGMQAEDQPDRTAINEAAVDWLIARWPDRVKVKPKLGRVGREVRLVP